MTPLEWYNKGYNDAYNQREPDAPDNDLDWANYMRGYKNGKKDADW